MQSCTLEKDKKIEYNITKDVKNLFKVEKEIDDTTIKDVRNLFRSKKEIDDTTVKGIRNLFRLEIFHDLEIIISKEKCRNISGREMCVMKYYSELRYAEKVSIKERLCSFKFVMIRKY